MVRRKEPEKPYKVIGVYDTETTNIDRPGYHAAFPVLHQLGLLSCPVEDVTPDNVREVMDVSMYRHALDVYDALDAIAQTPHDYVPVICCHNLAFDMYSLATWLSGHDVRVLAKTRRKPITFTIRDANGRPSLVIWDTAVFAQQSLESMGNDCGAPKAVGDWDYSLIRTPQTPLTKAETGYASADCYALAVWLSWWLRRNPDISPDDLGHRVVTKTGVVRSRRASRFGKLKAPRYKKDVMQLYLTHCAAQRPKSDDELGYMLASTRGGFTFCASRWASVPIEPDGSGRRVYAYDAVSMHPSHIVSHLYPVNFREASERTLDMAFRAVCVRSLDDMLSNLHRPFSVAFDAAFAFTNLRPLPGSVFADNGIYPLAAARYRAPKGSDDYDSDKQAQRDALDADGYGDAGEGIVSAYGKIESADYAVLYLTELAAWEVSRAYVWDNCEALGGYISTNFYRPTDLDILSVMGFYQAKNAYKAARETYFAKGRIDAGSAANLERLGIPEFVARGMEAGTLPDDEVEHVYHGLKADLNSIFGIACSNEYRRDTELTEGGIDYVGDFGLANAPKSSKVWYQFGQRIVGWSRVAQVIAMELAAPHVSGIVNGDTDSIKLYTDNAGAVRVDAALARYGRAVDTAKSHVCAKVRRDYPRSYDALVGIGHYEREFATDYFCASWNKAYCTWAPDTGYRFTIAGIHAARKSGNTASFIGVNGLADRYAALGMPFAQVCNLFLGYNTVYPHEVIRANARTFPPWGELYADTVEDWQGEVARVCEPMAQCLYPMSKTVNDTGNAANRVNYARALANNPELDARPKMVTPSGPVYLD